jgi:branched-chain amino acid transport system substrate-binding protein
LTWDAARMLLLAIQNTKGLTGNLEKDRKAVRDQLAQIKKFDGITGMMTFDGKTGDPVKCAVLVKISPEGAFTFYKSVCP